MSQLNPVSLVLYSIIMIVLRVNYNTSFLGMHDITLFGLLQPVLVT